MSLAMKDVSMNPSFDAKIPQERKNAEIDLSFIFILYGIMLYESGYERYFHEPFF